MTQNDDQFPPDYDDDLISPFDVQDQSGRRAMVLLFIILGLLLILGIFIYKTYEPGVRDRNSPPTINTSDTPYKVKPDNPGGTTTPHQDKQVYDVLDDQSTANPVTTAPLPEVPIERPVNPKPISAQDGLTSDALSSEGLARQGIATQAPSSTSTGVKPNAANIIVDPPSRAAGQVSSQPTQTTPTSPAVAPPTPKSVSASDSDFVVQVASVRSRDAAESVWQKIERDFDTVLSTDSYADIRRADLGDKGIFYRLRVAGLTDKAAAARLCETMKARNQACFVAKK